MAAVLKEDTGFWPVDLLILSYFGFAAILILGWWGSLPGATSWLAFHAAAGALLIYEIKRPNATSRVFRHWYPVFYVAACYKEMAVLIPVVRHTDADQWLARADYSFWHANPTVWLERIQTPGVTEFLQIIYTLFVPAVLLVAFVLWKKDRYPEFRYYAFLIALGFLVSYLGYLAVPARGPRFLLKNLQHVPLRGLWGFTVMQHTLDRLESAHYDCFPSGHTELTILAWWSSRTLTNCWFWAYFGYTLSIIFATVYLRYHYTVDVLAGAVVAAILILATPSIYRNLNKRLQVGRN
ncbi:MAG TPA: phosphatase PAP2 family protein [Bryobacteraceae bacterium]|nr:phosphatase PAP2 family protein [Bryobacteraceae bacterium]